MSRATAGGWSTDPPGVERGRARVALLFVGALAVLGACVAGAAHGPARAHERPPNLVLLYADDAGYADFGFQPDAEPDLAPLTPHIDSLAAAGARFTDFSMSACVCSPARAGLLTGRYQERFGHETNLPPGYLDGGLPLTETTLADRLRAAGYATACIGKWHLGYAPAFHPNERGFDHFFGLLRGSRSYLPYAEPTPDRVLQDDGEPTPEEGYVTDRLGDAAVRFVRAHADEPFFLYLAFTAPHGPLEPRPGAEALPALARIEDEQRRAYAGLVQALDDNVGKVLAVLDELGLADDTLVLFTNDNGGQTRTGALNTPLRGRKGRLWEGGLRVPAVMRWPGHVRAGRVIDAPVSALDLTPTFLAAAGAPTRDLRLDGVDLVPLLEGATSTPPERPLFWRSLGPAGPLAARLGRWKLVQHDRAVAPQLFDLATDLREYHDVAAEQPAVVERLRALAAAWEAELSDPLWGVD